MLQKTIYRQCLIAWLAVSNHCIHCHGEVLMEEVFEYPAISQGDTTVIESLYIPPKNLF
jgi:hypothetical protein